MISVLHIISGLGVGGAEGMLLRTAAGLAARGHRQHVVSLTGRGALADDMERAGIEVTALDLRRPRGFLSGAVELPRLVRRLRPDVVQGWMYHGDLAATAAHRLAGRAHGRRLAWNIRCSDMDLTRNARVIALSARLSALPDAVLSNSAAGAEVHIARGYRPRRLEIVPNGIDTERFRPDPIIRAALREEFGLDPSARIVIHVARVDPMKDHALFLDALRRMPEVTGLLVGKGTQALDLPANARGLGRRGDIAYLLSAADIFVSSSAFGEGFSNALAEAMSAGLAPVATDVGDARSIVGDTGDIIAPGDLEALTAALRSLAALDGYTLTRRGAAARARVVERFGMPAAIDRFEAFYRSLLPAA